MDRNERPEYASALYENDAQPNFIIGDTGYTMSRNTAKLFDFIKEGQPAHLAHQLIIDVGESLHAHSPENDGHTFDDEQTLNYLKLTELLFSMQRDFDLQNLQKDHPEDDDDYALNIEIAEAEDSHIDD